MRHKFFYGIEPGIKNFSPKDFSERDYDCHIIFQNTRGMPVAVSRHKKMDFWKVQNGFSTRDREAMEMNGSDFYRNAAQLKREEKMLREVKENGENGNAAGKTEE